MTRRFASAIAMVFVVALTLTGQGTADAVDSAAKAAPARLIIPKTGTNAAVIRVPVKNGNLMIGHRLQGTVYTAKNGDPPCDPTGSTMYAAHTWKAGHGTADDWVILKKGDLIRVGGCKFRVTKKEKWSDDRPIGSLSSPDGPPRIVLYACWPTDYDFAQVVFARKVKNKR